jgi:hypothetical protein
MLIVKDEPRVFFNDPQALRRPVRIRVDDAENVGSAF